MNDISYGSTFRIPVSQKGIHQSHKARLKALLGGYQNSLVGTGTTGYARISMPNSKDANFLTKLKAIGYKIYQVFEGEDIPKKNLDEYIDTCINNAEYKQFGKQKNRIKKDGHKATKSEIKAIIESEKNMRLARMEKNSEVVKEERFINDTSLEEQNRIKTTDDYKNVASKYGEAFAEAVFFLSKKK